jgi:TonB family protein
VKPTTIGSAFVVLTASILLAGCTSTPATGMRKITTLDALPAAVSAPRAVQTVPPVYPYEMRRSGVETTVFVSCMIDENGHVMNATADEKDAGGFGAAAVAALQKWTFAPGTRDGQPAAMHITVPFKFSFETEQERAALAAKR